MIALTIIISTLVGVAVGGVIGQAVARHRSREGLHMKLFLDALEVVEELTMTPDVIEQHRQRFSLSPSAVDLHHRANQITAAANRLRKRKET